MADSWTFNDFSAGWIPSDDALAGRKNGFLRMQNVELDQLGAVVMSQAAIASTGTALAQPAHTIWSKFIGGVRKRYFALTDGSVYRDAAAIILAGTGSTTRAAFGVAFNYTLILSGASKKKDDGTNPVFNLGIDEPNVAPIVVVGGAGPISGDIQYIQINVSKN